MQHCKSLRKEEREDSNKKLWTCDEKGYLSCDCPTQKDSKKVVKDSKVRKLEGAGVNYEYQPNILMKS